MGGPGGEGRLCSDSPALAESPLGFQRRAELAQAPLPSGPAHQSRNRGAFTFVALAMVV